MQDICYHCRKQGHWKAECPQLHRRSEQLRSTSLLQNSSGVPEEQLEHGSQRPEHEQGEENNGDSTSLAQQCGQETSQELEAATTNAGDASASNAELAELQVAIGQLQSEQQSLAGACAHASITWPTPFRSGTHVPITRSVSLGFGHFVLSPLIGRLVTPSG